MKEFIQSRNGDLVKCKENQTGDLKFKIFIIRYTSEGEVALIHAVLN